MDKELIEKIAVRFADFGIQLLKKDAPYTDPQEYAESIIQLIKEAGYVQRWKECPECHGDGKDHYLLRCDGKGIIRNVDHCNTCNGTGKVLKYAELADKGKNE